MSQAAPWYDLAHLPAGQVCVRVMWGFEVFEAARLWRGGPRSRVLTWCRMVPGRDGEGAVAQWLPPKVRTGAPWPAAPACWQPIDAVVWSWPQGTAPAPLPVHHVPRLWSSRQSFGAVDEAEAADLAREMEAERETARAQGEAPSRGRSSSGPHTGLPSVGKSKTGQKRPLWWLDTSGLRHDPPGSILRRDAEARVMRALAGDGFVQAASGTGLGINETRLLSRVLDEAEIRRMAEREAKATPEYKPRFTPTPADRDDYLTAIGWWGALGYSVEVIAERRLTGRRGFGQFTTQQRLLALAASTAGLSWADIGYVTGVSRQAAQQGYAAAIDMVTRVANGRQTKAAASHRRALAAVRDGNRAARRAGG